jgi:hypothetical protein
MDRDMREDMIRYLSGGLVAVGLPVLVFELLMLVRGEPLNQIIGSTSYLIVAFLGSTIGGFLVGRSTDREPIAAGAATGAVGYVLHEVILRFLLGYSMVGGLYILLTYLAGGVTGSHYILSRLSEREKIEEPLDGE